MNRGKGYDCNYIILPLYSTIQPPLYSQSPHDLPSAPELGQSNKISSQPKSIDEPSLMTGDRPGSAVTKEKGP